MIDVRNALRAGVYSLFMGFSALAITTPISGYGQPLLTSLVSDTMNNWEGLPAFFNTSTPNFFALSPVSCFVAEQALVVDESGNYVANDQPKDAYDAAIACSDTTTDLAADSDFLYDNLDDQMSCNDSCYTSCDDTCVTEPEEYSGGGAVGAYGGGGYGGGGGGWGGGGGGGWGGGGAVANANAEAKAKAKVIIKIKVPEPSTYLLMGGMALVIIGAARRRREASE